MKVNLLNEINTYLEDHGKSFSDVLKVGLREGNPEIHRYEVTWTWEDFVNIASKVWYNPYYDEDDIIDPYLMISGDNWWLSRVSTIKRWREPKW